MFPVHKVSTETIQSSRHIDVKDSLESNVVHKVKVQFKQEEEMRDKALIDGWLGLNLIGFYTNPINIGKLFLEVHNIDCKSFDLGDWKFYIIDNGNGM